MRTFIKDAFRSLFHQQAGAQKVGYVVRPTHYLLVNSAGVYVKVAELFEGQGGLTEEWGKAWEPCVSSSLYGARREGIRRRRERYPNSHVTLGEDEPMCIAWPEARGQ